MAGLLLVVAGIWVLTQVLGGNALGRLGITGTATEPGEIAGAAVGSAAKTGVAGALGQLQSPSASFGEG